uniref:Uncharacterized protein n=1 Tax=viral metagenome TaxID=1070528 RepID=A0A6C0E826_9ZZZZ
MSYIIPNPIRQQQELNPFAELMFCVCTCSEDGCAFGKLMNYLRDTSIDYTQNDNQLIREINCGRLKEHHTKIIYSILVNERNYIMPINS